MCPVLLVEPAALSHCMSLSAFEAHADPKHIICLNQPSAMHPLMFCTSVESMHQTSAMLSFCSGRSTVALVYNIWPCCARHEGEGSVFALLKARGWAVELSAGESGMSFSAASLFSINIILTDEGAQCPRDSCKEASSPACALQGHSASSWLALQAARKRILLFSGVSVGVLWGKVVRDDDYWFCCAFSRNELGPCQAVLLHQA
jgi:hypothetical protein